jgi:hypothetical protein
MTGLVLAPGETNIGRVVQLTRQLMEGRTNANGLCTLTPGNGAISGLGAFSGGSGYQNGTYSSIALTGGSGTGATANIVVSGNTVISVTLVFAGSGYVAGDILTAPIPGPGAILSAGLTLTGAGGTPGSYPGTPMVNISSSGTGASFNVSVPGGGGISPSFSIASGGSGYAIGDTIQTGVGPGVSGDEFTVVTVSTGSGFGVAVTSATGSFTIVQAQNCSTSSSVFLFPATADAAAGVADIYVPQKTVLNGQFTIIHGPSASTDRSFWFVCLG